MSYPHFPLDDGDATLQLSSELLDALATIVNSRLGTELPSAIDREPLYLSVLVRALAAQAAYCEAQCYHEALHSPDLDTDYEQSLDCLGARVKRAAIRDFDVYENGPLPSDIIRSFLDGTGPGGVVVVDNR